eukprot:1157228-Pelagomonas_calceolata.AAC.5
MDFGNVTLVHGQMHTSGRAQTPKAQWCLALLPLPLKNLRDFSMDHTECFLTESKALSPLCP